MAFTDSEKARIKHHLGYPDWVALSNSIQLGFPAGGQPLYLVEQAFQRLTPGGEESVRCDLCNCEEAEGQRASARSRFRAAALGTLRLNPEETRQLGEELTYWRRKLADDLGVTPNPYSQAEHLGEPGGINARTVG